METEASGQTVETCFKGTSTEAIYACTLEIKRHKNSQSIFMLFARRGSLWLMRGMFEEAINDYMEAIRVSIRRRPPCVNRPADS